MMDSNSHHHLLATIAVLEALFSSILITVYAQPSTEQQNSRACPEGFEMNRGKCEMEPEITTELVCPNNLSESPLGNCIVGVGSPVAHVCPNGYSQHIGEPFCRNVEDFDDTAEKVYQCASGYELDTTIENVPRCFQVIPKVEQEIQEPCPSGSTLDSARNVCVAKPGRGNR
jgi:hypothetical protein